MPELPEVETVVRGLREHVVGRVITGVQIGWEKTVQSPAAADFVAGMVGRTIAAVGRRGKYILLDFDNDTHLTIHLRMTGRLFIETAGATAGKHTRLVWAMDDGHEVHFVDPRKFGRVALLATIDLDALDARLGPEPLLGLTPAILAGRLQARRIPIKQALLDQSVIAGIGNIYADEALYHAAIHPQRPANSLSAAELTRLTEGILHVLSTAVTRHGTTLRDEQFKGLEGRMGENQGFLAVFRRTGQKCPRCQHIVQRIVLGGRSTHFCANCQT
jgi:formamidopyrimidine-DNA glycosylase